MGARGDRHCGEGISQVRPYAPERLLDHVGLNFGKGALLLLLVAAAIAMLTRRRESLNRWLRRGRLFGTLSPRAQASRTELGSPRRRA